MRPGFHSSMFAIRESSSVYHLLYDDQDYTLCGFRAAKHDSQSPAKAILHVVEIVHHDRELCKQCDKMKNRRKRGTERGLSKHNPEDSGIKESRRPGDAVQGPIQ